MLQNPGARILMCRPEHFAVSYAINPWMDPQSWARDTLAWNPLLHAIDWFRAGFFVDYQPHWLDRRYLLMAAVLSVLIGLALERGLRRRLSPQQLRPPSIRRGAAALSEIWRQR